MTGDNWLLYLMLLLTQPSQLKHLLVSEADGDRCLFPCLWRDTVARRLEQWTGVDEVFPRGQPSRRCEVARREEQMGSVQPQASRLLLSRPDRAGCSAATFEKGRCGSQSFLHPGDSCVDYAWLPKGLLLYVDLARDTCYSLGEFAAVLG